MTMNTKTPAMVLQELTVKLGLAPPNYTLLRELTKQNTHQNEFYYQVTAAYKCTVGCGSSKQIAKHDAARGILKMLEEDGIYKPAENPMQDFIPGLNSTMKDGPVKTAVNCISTLSDLCDENKIPMPQFVEISDVGPPHCRQFTYECSVGSVKTRATASTKKQAKQIAAKEILDRIKDILPQLKAEHNPDAKEIAEKEADVITKYNEISPYISRTNVSVKVEDYSNVFTKVMEEKNITYGEIEPYLEQPTEENLKKLADILDLSFQVNCLQEKNPTILIFIFSTNSPFTASGLGPDYTTAYEATVRNACYLIKLLLNKCCY